MRTTIHLLLGAGCRLALGILCAGAGGSMNAAVFEAQPALVPAPAAPLAKRRAPESLELPGLFRPGRNLHDLGAVPPGRIQAANQAAAARFAGIRPGPQRVGLVRTPPQGRLSFKAGHASRLARQGQHDLWTMAIRSPGSFGMRLSFTNVDLDAGSMMVYARDGQEVVVARTFH